MSPFREVPPDCRYGYSQGALQALLGDRLDKFYRWAAGSTGMLCDGREYDHESRAYRPSACAGNPHGSVTYTIDVERFMSGGKQID